MNADSPSSACAALISTIRSQDRWKLSNLAAHGLATKLRGLGVAADVRVAFAGNVVFEPLPEHLLVHLAAEGIAASTYSVPFGQLLQELLDPASELRRFDPVFLHLHYEVDELLQDVFDRRAFETAEHRRAALAEIVDFVVPTVHAALKSTAATILLSNFILPSSFSLGLADFRTEYGEQEFFSDLNTTISRALREDPRVQIVDVCTLAADHGRRRARDPRLYYTSKIAWSDSFFGPLADRLSRHIQVSLGRIRKCLVVDFDNTLWHGVLGEEGPLGVKIGVGDPAGEAHLALQRFLVSLKRRGILLAACSKNNPGDVAEMFDLRPDMPLKRDDFATMEIGWKSKDEGLRRIAENLGIGTESLVFLDDNPAEIALIERMLPEVQCVLVPEDSGRLAICLDSVHGLDRTFITAEDLTKDRQYKDAAARHASRAEFVDLRDYLHSLCTSITITSADGELLARAHQLMLKTNQFNASGRRYSLAELEEFALTPGNQILMVHARDRFGDLGWIGVSVLRESTDGAYHIENWVLSCRALGRGIEIAVLTHIEQIVFGKRDCHVLTADYRATKKNAQVATFFSAQGFEMDSDSKEVRRYTLARRAPRAGLCDWITVTSDRVRSQ